MKSIEILSSNGFDIVARFIGDDDTASEQKLSIRPFYKETGVGELIEVRPADDIAGFLRAYAAAYEAGVASTRPAVIDPALIGTPISA